MQSSASPSAQIEIRRLTEDDAQDFYLLRLEALEHEPQAFGQSPEEHRAMTLESTARRLGGGPEGPHFVLGALVDGHLVGMAGFYQDEGAKNRHRGRIWGVYVTEAWRGKGIARVLLAEIIERARVKPELEQLLLAVAAGRDAARHLYESLGFEVYGREPRAIKIGDKYIDEELMVLRIRR
jgi:ribosomal protein S18 acetylase RimI-like enzyme